MLTRQCGLCAVFESIPRLWYSRLVKRVIPFLLFLTLVSACEDREVADSGRRARESIEDRQFADGLSLPGKTLRFELVCRKRYSFGAAARARLYPEIAGEPAGAGDLWFRTSSVESIVDGKPLPRKKWSMGKRLGTAEPVGLDLATLVGDALAAKGPHRIELNFRTQILRPDPRSGLADATPVWTGDVTAGPAAFEVIALRPEQIVASRADDGLDAARAFVVRLSAGSQAIELFPAGNEVRRLAVPLSSPRAKILVTVKEDLPFALAWNVVKQSAETGNKTILGHLSLHAGARKDMSHRAGELDLAPVLGDDLQSITLAIELVPSARAAYLDPQIDSYWDMRLDCGKVTFEAGP